MTEVHDYYRLLFSRAGTAPSGPAGEPLTASMFSFNHEQGACPACKGLGTVTVSRPGAPDHGPGPKPLRPGRWTGPRQGGSTAIRTASSSPRSWQPARRPGWTSPGHTTTLAGRTGRRSQRHLRSRLRHRLVLQARPKGRGFPFPRALERLRGPGRRGIRAQARRPPGRGDAGAHAGRSLPRLRREEAQARFPRRDLPRARHRRALRDDRGRGPRVLREGRRGRAARRPRRGRHRGPPRGDLAPPRAHPRRRAGLPAPRSRLVHAFGRRGPAAPTGRAARRQAHGRHLRPGRADARPPSPRHAEAPRTCPRPHGRGQHGRRGRARPRGRPGRGPRSRPGARRGPRGRPDRRRRPAGGDRARPRFGDRALSRRTRGAAGAVARNARTAARDRRSPGEQPPRRRRLHPDGPPDGRDRGLRERQVEPRVRRHPRFEPGRPSRLVLRRPRSGAVLQGRRGRH
ncbi:MAG: hypothetical protein MZU91_11200 [Desulfosudis oleivorans]|nr:hypothetical protein [Desulfosudis oleivorans]